jgi:type IV pilus biogenesis protein CpaD/CtpE
MMGMIFVALAVFSAGCGSSDSEESLTKAEFVKQANRICKESEKERGEIISEAVQQANPKGNLQAQQEDALEKALPTYEDAARKIDELGAPEGSEDTVDAIVEAMEEASEKVRANLQTAAVSNVPFNKANELTESYGLNACTI